MTVHKSPAGQSRSPHHLRDVDGYQTCPQCGRRFDGDTSNGIQKYCSATCRDRRAADRSRARLKLRKAQPTAP